jgi:hypothetical protein
MAVEIGQVYRQNPPPETREHSYPVPTTPNIKIDNTGFIDWAASLKYIANKRYFLSFQARPMEPIEPTSYSLSENEWNEYVKKRDSARAYALENDLRGTF